MEAESSDKSSAIYLMYALKPSFRSYEDMHEWKRGTEFVRECTH